ncbi:MAG: 2-C-methyl-D-erythritol 2,4-cyclodiphosphate synthase [Trueperaceae bacterium]
MDAFRVGFGEDAHALQEGVRLWLGGVEIPHAPVGAAAHSDGDALLHALCDALLAAWGLGDIGQYFPPSNPNYANLASQVILQTVQHRIADQVGTTRVVNVAAVITMDRPPLGPHRLTIQRTLAELLHIEPSRVGLGFKTSEGLAPKHVQARVTVLTCLDPAPGA